MSKNLNDTPNVLNFKELQQSQNPRLNAVITIYRGIQPNPYKYITLKELFLEIASDDASKISTSTVLVDYYTQHLIEHEKGIKKAKKQYDEKKSQLNGFSIGEFTYRNDKKENCLKYVPCFVFDLDGCKSKEEVKVLMSQISSLQYVFAAFPSPSGHGLRIFVWVSATYETHRNRYMQVLKSLCNDLKITMDKKNGLHFDSTCQNESRFFYYTAIDKKNVYINLESITFVATKMKDIFIENSKIEKGDVDINKLMFTLDTQLNGNFEGRNDRLFHLAIRFKNNDVPIWDAEHYATKFIESDFTQKEILTTIKSAYKIAKTQYNEYQKAQFLSEKEDQTPPNEALKKEKQYENPIKNDKKRFGEDFLTEKEQNLSIEIHRQIRREKIPSKSMNAQIKNYLMHYYEFRRNIVANSMEYCLKGLKKWETLRTSDLIDELLDENFKSVEQTLSIFLTSSQVKDYDPFMGYFESLPKWDGVDYIGELTSFVEAEDEKWWSAMFRKALVRNCACATGHINYNKQCIIFFGGTQAGKSKFIRFLTPTALKQYYNENPNIGNKDDKDARLSIAKNFISNLDEIGDASERELKEMKSILSRESVNERLIYDKANTTMVRKTTFWGSTDKEDFLIDEQGNVRWVIIKIKSILHDEGGEKGYTKKVDMDKVWGQAFHLLKDGFLFNLTKEEFEYSENNNKNKYMKKSMEEELILKYFIPSQRGTEKSVFLTATDITLRLEDFSKKITLRNVGIALRKLGFERVYGALNDARTRGYYVLLAR